MNAIGSTEENGNKVIEEYKKNLLNAFFCTFCSANIEEIQKVLRGLRQNKNILEWNDIESFCSLFLSFHLRETQPFNVPQLLLTHQFPQPLLEFLETCTFIESHTDQFAYLEKMENIQYKDEIISHLEKLLKLLPTQREFADLVGKIH